MHTNYKLMSFGRNINENRDVKFLEYDYLLVQWCVKLTFDFTRNRVTLHILYVFLAFVLDHF